MVPNNQSPSFWPRKTKKRVIVYKHNQKLIQNDAISSQKELLSSNNFRTNCKRNHVHKPFLALITLCSIFTSIPSKHSRITFCSSGHNICVAFSNEILRRTLKTPVASRQNTDRPRPPYSHPRQSKQLPHRLDPQIPQSQGYRDSVWIPSLQVLHVCTPGNDGKYELLLSLYYQEEALPHI